MLPISLTYLKNISFIFLTSIGVIKDNFYFFKVNNVVLELRGETGRE